MDVKDSLKNMTRVTPGKSVNRGLIYLLGVLGVALIGLALWSAISDWRQSGEMEDGAENRQEVLEELLQPIRSLKRVLSDEQVQRLAVRAVETPATIGDLFAYVNGRIGQVDSVEVFSTDTGSLNPRDLGPNGFALMEMILSVLEEKHGLMQIHHVLQPPRLYDATAIRSGDGVVGAMVVSLDPEYLLAGFQPDVSAVAAIRLTQFNNRQPANTVGEWGDLSRLGPDPERLAVAGTEFRIEFPRLSYTDLFSGIMRLFIGLAGLLLLAAAVLLSRLRALWESEQSTARERRAALDLKSPPEPVSRAEPLADTEATSADADFAAAPAAGTEAADAETDGVEEPERKVEPEPPPLMHLQYDITERRRHREAAHAPVELSPGIFRAYDIRGVIDKTLDSGIAHSVGQAIGTLALEQDAGPLVVARDGRLSGPYLMEGMIEGITAAGCDVLDIGAVPTGVLYYAAHEFARGSGVMITGSHNPPDYNGFKIMIGGDTLYGDAITAIHARIVNGTVREGRGKVTRKNVVPDYIQRVAGDVQVEREMKIVIDCGNGIGGVCAADTLRAIGVEVLPLFDEVDGTFPNHHPDPSEPENLQDLIESVRLMDADLGLAFDGDADRLGVVTLAGNIIYPDRVMMLLALDVLDRNPGATIIYDVKCTGHLPKVIEEAGGKPVMYKTGHSLIKAKMKEIGSPFAGEMSGHFFFGERWYGVDDGIYAAARLLEILGSTETPPEAILNALPSSFSTPELKVKMQEGENHAFIEAFRLAAQFPGARISTIDGLRADFDDAWGLVRASNTTPILVVRFDAETEQALTRIKAEFRSQMLAINPELELPF